MLTHRARISKTVTTIITGICALLAGPAQSATELALDQKIQADAKLQEYKLKLDHTAAFLQDVRSNLNRTLFDIEALLDSLDYDADAIINFSKEAIAFEQYPGLLRGPQGTLLGRAGNALDQSVFLAKLLHDSGYDARVVEGRISTQDAARLLQEITRERKPRPRSLDVEALGRVFEQYGVSSSVTEKDRKLLKEFAHQSAIPSEMKYYGRVKETMEFLIEELDSAGLSLGSDQALAELIEESQQYFWVEYKDSAASGWKTVHPSFVGEAVFETLEPSRYLVEEVPQNLMHKLRFQVYLERRIGGKLETVQLTKPWERPAANYLARPLVFANVPFHTGKEESPAFDPNISSSDMIIPVLGSSVAPGALYFDLQGNTVDPMALGSPAAGIVKEVGRAFGDAVAGIGGEELRPELTAQILKLTLIAPDGTETEYQRTVMDRIGAAARASNTVPSNLPAITSKEARELWRRLTIMVSTGDVPWAWVTDQTLRRAVDTIPLIKHDLGRAFSDGATSASGKIPETPTSWEGYPMLVSILEMAANVSPGSVAYRSGPAVVIHGTGFTQSNTVIDYMDIVSNPRRAVKINDGRVSLDAATVAKAGVWETAVEGELLTGNTNGQDVWSVFENARKSKLDYAVLRPEEEVRSIEISSDTSAVLQRELSKGFAIVTLKSETSPGSLGWWRIDPATGSTLGQFGDGKGTAATESLISWETAGYVISGGLYVYGMAQCDASYGSAATLQAACCHAMNAITFAIGLELALAKVTTFLMGLLWDSWWGFGPTSNLACDQLPPP